MQQVSGTASADRPTGPARTASYQKQQTDEHQLAAEELLAGVDINTALEFVQQNQQQQQQQQQQQPTASLPPLPPLPTVPQAKPSTIEEDSTTSNKNHRLKTISTSILRTVSRKRDFSPSTHSLPPTLQSVLDDHHHELIEVNRPFFIVDLRSLTAAAERHQANPNQIRRVEECKRFFSLRYEPIFTSLAEGKIPPSLVKVAEWRRKLQLVSILRKKREQSNQASSSSSSIKFTIDHHHPQSSLLTRNTYKWICLSSRKRRTIWEICPEDIQDYLSTNGIVEDEEELKEAERLFGKFDQHPIRHGKSNRQRVNSMKTSGSSRWTPTQNQHLSDNDSINRSPISAQTSFHHLRKPSSATSSSQGNLRNSYRYSSDMSSQDNRSNTRLPTTQHSDIDEPQAPSSLVNPEALSVDLSNLSWSGKTPVSSPYVSSAIPISPLEVLKNAIPSSTLPSDHTPPPHLKFNRPDQSSNNSQETSRNNSDHINRLSPSKTSFDIKSKIKKHNHTWNALDDLPTSGVAGSSSSTSPFRSNSQPAILAHREQQDFLNQTKQTKQRLSSLGKTLTTNHSILANHHHVIPAGSSPERSHSIPVHPNLSRTSSAKGLLNFAKRSIISDSSTPLPSSSTPPAHPALSINTSPQKSLSSTTPKPSSSSTPTTTTNHSKSFLNKPPRDWRGWKFDKTHLIFRNNNNNSSNQSDKKLSNGNEGRRSDDLMISIPPVNDILFVSPFINPLRSTTANNRMPPFTTTSAFASNFSPFLSNNHNYFSSLNPPTPILVTDLIEDDVHQVEMLIVMMKSQIEDLSSKSNINQIDNCLKEAKKYRDLLPEMRREIGLKEIEIKVLDDYCTEDEDEGSETGSMINRKKRSKRDVNHHHHSNSNTSTSSSISTSPSITTTEEEEEGSVLSQSIQHEDPDSFSPFTNPLELLSTQDTLDSSLLNIEHTLQDMEDHKIAFRERLSSQIEDWNNAISKHEIFLDSCEIRNELMRKDRELVNQIRRTIKVFGQEGRMIDQLQQTLTNSISRPIITLIVSILTKLIGISLKLFALHSFVYRNPFKGLFWTISGRYLYTCLVGFHVSTLTIGNKDEYSFLKTHLPDEVVDLFLLKLSQVYNGFIFILSYLNHHHHRSLSLFIASFNLIVKGAVILNFSLVLISFIGLLSRIVFFNSRPPFPPITLPESTFKKSEDDNDVKMKRISKG
ncbi:hypothetical protein MJO28_004224 [Puccinia striiformis f. sp. tritici]|uniref:Uncharacterized protein n=1 Tax=Puccinia striiformis f. sp. tritici TaxID=168172 RepID=A0ACC0ENU2_9BASI|nr:hypothetical protein MJO28_004224 [Puccinia striiformis f. sp. tritici]